MRSTTARPLNSSSTGSEPFRCLRVGLSFKVARITSVWTFTTSGVWIRWIRRLRATFSNFRGQILTLRFAQISREQKWTLSWKGLCGVMTASTLLDFARRPKGHRSRNIRREESLAGYRSKKLLESTDQQKARRLLAEAQRRIREREEFSKRLKSLIKQPEQSGSHSG